MHWLSGWAYRRKLTIDSNKVSSTLSNFPVLIHLSSSSGLNGLDVTSIFTLLGVNSKKIAVTDADNNELYVEIEEWDNSNNVAWLWVKVTSISSSVDTTLYLYYDPTHADNDTYVGVTGSTPAEAVWDSNFSLVCHMNDNPDTSSVMDSTSNDNDGTKKGANEPNETDGQIGKAQSLDGSNDYIEFPADPDYKELNGKDLSAFMWIKTSAVQTGVNDYGVGLVGSYGISIPTPNQFWQLSIQRNTATAHAVVLYRRDNNTELKWLIGTSVINDGEPHFVGFIKRGLVLELWVDGAKENSGTLTQDGDTDNNANLLLGVFYNSYYEGDTDEVQINNDAWSSAWVGASYETQRDNLINFGVQNTIVGLDFIMGKEWIDYMGDSE